MFDVDRNSATLNVSESRSNVPLSRLVLDALVSVHGPAAMALPYLSFTD
jgi:hypothetical protein